MAYIREHITLKGRTVLITGATGHLGQVMAETAAELGGNLVLVDRPGSDFQDMEKTILNDCGVKVRSYACDLENEQDRTQLTGEIISEFDSISCLVNNAAFVGTSELEGWSTRFEDQSLRSWRSALEVNLTAIFHLCQAFMPLLKNAKGGNIVNIASIYGELGPDWGLYENTEMANPAAYASSKGGVIQLTRWLATTVAPHVRVNCISPGGLFRNQPEDFVEKYANRTPLGRMAVEDDFRGAFAYLASDLSSYVTGQNLKVDGGWGAW
jgi:NAD(P)-dependent dehydrogenase (short-subunit alcohol dehydrogenase family)